MRWDHKRLATPGIIEGPAAEGPAELTADGAAAGARGTDGGSGIGGLTSAPRICP